MKKTNSSFQELPIQFEWAFPILIGFCAYLFMVSDDYVSILSVLTALIILNGWISSRATAEIYSDILLVIDVLGMFFYFCMVLSLNLSRNKLNPEYWLYCAGVCMAYFFWDLAILPLVGKENWKNRFRSYVILMAISAILFVCLFLIQKNYHDSELIVVILGSLLWGALLFKWHWDKLKKLL